MEFRHVCLYLSKSIDSPWLRRSDLRSRGFNVVLFRLVPKRTNDLHYRDWNVRMMRFIRVINFNRVTIRYLWALPDGTSARGFLLVDYLGVVNHRPGSIHLRSCLPRVLVYPLLFFTMHIPRIRSPRGSHLTEETAFTRFSSPERANSCPIGREKELKISS